jgi:hypothetical protein
VGDFCEKGWKMTPEQSKELSKLLLAHKTKLGIRMFELDEYKALLDFVEKLEKEAFRRGFDSNSPAARRNSELQRAYNSQS